MKQEWVRCFSILGMKIRITSNYREILFDDEYFLGKNGKLHSLLSNFRDLVPCEPAVTEKPDVEIRLNDSAGRPFRFSMENGLYLFEGPLRELEETCGDKRASIFGNMGIFSKILVRELEHRGIFSFHSTSFVTPGTNRLFLVLGGSGAGKSTVLLKALKEGMLVFGTELTHFGFHKGKTVFYKGSLWQNCRMGNLVEDFPVLLEKFSINYQADGNPWHRYLSVDLHPWQFSGDVMEDPEVVILFPRIESGRIITDRFEVKKGETLYSLYENLADKVSPPSCVYKREFIPSVDSASDQVARIKAAKDFLAGTNIRTCWKILSGPDGCLENIIY